VNGSQIPDTTVITVANTATSMLRVTDAASGCILWSDTIVVQVDSTSAVNITSDLPLSGTLCLGDTVTLSTNKAFAQYIWSNGSTTQEQLVTKSETFVLKAVSDNGCPSYDTARVAINIPPDVYFRLNGRVLASTDQSLVYSSGAENCTEVRYVPSEDKFDVNWGATNFIIATGYQAVVSEMDTHGSWITLRQKTGSFTVIPRIRNTAVQIRMPHLQMAMADTSCSTRTRARMRIKLLPLSPLVSTCWEPISLQWYSTTICSPMLLH
jgi:hypothetical protein